MLCTCQTIYEVMLKVVDNKGAYFAKNIVLFYPISARTPFVADSQKSSGVIKKGEMVVQVEIAPQSLSTMKAIE